MWPVALARRKSAARPTTPPQGKIFGRNFFEKPKNLVSRRFFFLFFSLSLEIFGLLNLHPNQIGAAKYQATPLPPNTKSYSYSIPHLSKSLHNSIESHGGSSGHVKQTVRCCKKSYLYALLYLVLTIRLFGNNLSYFLHKLRIFF